MWKDECAKTRMKEMSDERHIEPERKKRREAEREKREREMVREVSRILKAIEPFVPVPKHSSTSCPRLGGVVIVSI